MSQPMQGWYPPPPPPPPAGPGGSGIKPGRVFLGVGIVLGVHLLTIVLAWVIALIFAPGAGSSVSGDRVGIFLLAATILQGLLMIAALTVGIIMAVRKDGGIGIGIVIGWAVGIMISPVVGFGVCVAILNGSM